MKRREFVTSVLVGGLATPVIGDQQRSQSDSREDEHAGHGRGDRGDRATNHAVSFGYWLPTPDYPAVPAEENTADPQPIDRFLADPNPRRLNGHFLTPNNVKIEVGDTVSFLIAGFHLLLVYGPGVDPEDIDRTKLILSPPMTFPPLIDDPNRRLYRGLDPRTQAQDRVEVVGFNTRGKYLVICGVLPHFFEAATANTTARFVMFGWVDVRRD